MTTDDALGLALVGALDDLAEAVALIGPDWHYRYVSPRAARLIGRPVEELVGALVWDVFPEVVGTPEHEVALRALREQTPDDILWFFERTGRWYSQRQVPAGGGLLVLVDDVTEQQRAAHRAERLVEIGESLAAAVSPQDVHDVVVRLALPQTGSQDGGLVLVEEQAGVARPLGWPSGPVPADWQDYPLALATPATLAWRTRRTVLLPTAQDVARACPDAVAPLAELGLVGIAALPLVADGRCLGALMAAYRDELDLSDGDRQFLSTAAAIAAQALVRVSLLDVERRSVRALQRSLLPQALPQVPGVETAARYVASDRAAQVGGDWYDVVVQPGGTVALVLGDVEGHDLEAAALMGLIRSAVRAYVLEGHPPAIVLARANSFLAGLELGRIVTVALSQLHPAELLITTVSAGHPPTVVVSPGGEVTEVPAETGPPLGVHDEGLHWLETTSTLPVHGVLAMFTDGLVEVRGHDMEEGLQRVREVLLVHRGAPLDDLAGRLLAGRGTSSDDVAVLLSRLTVDAAAEQRVVRHLPATPASVFLARRFARQLLHAWDLPEPVVEQAELVVSELVTNAARHSEDDLELGLAVAGRVLRVTVADTSHRMPHAPREPVREDATAGRGLLLVEAASDRWGVESEGLAKLVWAEFDL